MSVGAWASVVGGAGAVMLVAWDVWATLLHPSRRGPVARLTDRASWRVVRGITRRIGGRRGIAFAGPVAMLATFLAWVLLLWVGYALIYLPFLERLSYAPGVPFLAKGVFEALYLSGVALTTVGFGDVVAGTDALRLVTVVEGASGLATFTAAITYLLSVYSLLANLRADALRFADLRLESLNHAAAFALHGGASTVEGLHRSLVETHQNARRFRVLYHFESEREEESVVVLLRASICACLVLRWGVGREAVAFAPQYGEALVTALHRVMHDYRASFLGEASDKAAPSVSGSEAMTTLLEAVARADSSAARGDDARTAELGRFIAATQLFLDDLSAAYLHPQRPVLGVDAETASGRGSG